MATVKRRKHKLDDGTYVDGNWQVRYVDPTGAERSREFVRRGDAQRFANDVESEKNRGVYVDLATRGRVTFREFAEEWRSLQPTWKPATADAHAWRLNKHIYPVLGDLRMAAITEFDVKRMVKRVVDADGSAATVSSVAATARGVFLSAVRQGVIAKNPMVGVKLPALDDGDDEGEAVALTYEQFRDFEAALPKRFRVAAWIGLGTGLRVGEVCGLTEDRISFLGKRLVTVNRQMLPTGRFGPPKTKASRRKVPATKSLIDKLSAHLAEFPDPVRARRLVLTAEKGGPARDALIVAVRDAATAAGMGDHQRFHSLRHTYASMLLSSGLSIKVAQKYLGHSKAQETLDTYGHMLPRDEDRALVVIEEGVSSFLIGPESDKASVDNGESPGQTP